MRKLMFIIFFCLIFFSFSYAKSPELDFDIYGFCNSISNFSSEFIDGEEYSKIVMDIQNGEFKFDYKTLFGKIAKIMSSEIKNSISLIIQIVIIAMLTGFLSNIKSSFNGGGVGEIAFYVTYIVIITLIITSFINISNIAKDTINELTSFMEVLLPVMIGFMASTGAVASTSMIYPIIIFATQTIVVIVNNFLLPIMTTGFAIGIIANISNKISVSKIASMIKSGIMWVLGIVLTIFVGILSLEGSIASTVDGVTVKTAKFMFSNGVPVVGKLLGDSIDTILGSTLVLKDAIGFVGVIALIGIILVPILKIGIMIICYSLASAFIEPFAESRVCKCLDDTSSMGKVVMGMVLTVSIVFVISVVSMLKMSNIVAMYR